MIRVPHVSFGELEARRRPTESRMTAVPNSVTNVLPDLVIRHLHCAVLPLSGSAGVPLPVVTNVRLCRSSTPR